MRYHNQDLICAGEQMIGIEGFGGYTIKQYQQEAIEILKEIDRICRKYKITYFLMYGSLLGAVRHHGFIPWDDDADVILTRENYNRLKEACREELSDKYDFVSYLEKDGSGYTFSRIRKKNSAYIIKSEISRHGRNAGFYIDVMTLDYLSDHKMHAWLQKKSLLALHRLASPGFCQGREHLGAFGDGVVKLLKLVLGRKNALRLMEKLLSSAKEENSSKVISNYLIQTRLEMHVFDKRHFTESCYVPYEGMELPIPKDPISLINFCYCKGNIAKHMYLETRYEDEYEAVMKKDYHRYSDIMFIPAERARDSHLEVVFDDSRNSAYYDSCYFTRFDKKENDRCAVKERHYKEKAAKYLAVMTQNEAIARLCCKELKLRELLADTAEKYADAGAVPLKECSRICDGLIKMDIVYQDHLTEEEMLYAVYILLRCNYLPSSMRLIKRLEYLYPKTENKRREELKAILDTHLDAYYAVFEDRAEAMEAFCMKYRSKEYLLADILGGIMAYRQQEYALAEQKLLSVLEVDENTFLAYYYLGKIVKERDADKEKARHYWMASLDSTTYMPLLELALHEIEKAE